MDQITFSTLEIIRSLPTGQLRAAVLDFDGTLSLVREGWQRIMQEYFLEILAETPQGKTESEQELTRCIRDFIELQTGKPTIFQCRQLSDEVKKRGGNASDPDHYKQVYHSRLQHRIGLRLERLISGNDSPEDHLVPGARNLLELLKKNGLILYLASGTDEVSVRHEAKLLQIDSYFDGRIFAVKDDTQPFSKASVIRYLLDQHQLAGSELIGFGDGHVETENVHQVGGYAVGVALNETNRAGIDPSKRKRLIESGADLIIPDYRNIEELHHFLYHNRNCG